MTINVQHSRRTVTAALALALVLVPGFVATPSARAQTYKVLHSFTAGTDGATAQAGLVRDAAGNLYSTTSLGGAYGNGTVFKVDKTGAETVLYNFTGGTDGGFPSGALVRDAAGNLYGTTVSGGTGTSCLGGTASCGTVFKLDATGIETVLYSFTGPPDGGNPSAGLLRDAAGNLYGTSAYGGYLLACFSSSGCGTVFKLDSTGTETLLHRFSIGDGAFPLSGLIPDAAGNLYATTYSGGAYDYGTVFRLDRITSKLTVLYSFNLGPNGANPGSGLIRDAADNLYGTTAYGGDLLACSGGCGTVFKLDSAGTETVLYSFTGGTDGANPVAGLVRDAAGNLYGTAPSGGDASCSLSFSIGCGTVFKLDTTGTETVLHTFTGKDGAGPYASLIRDGSGNLYGTTLSGGDTSCDLPYGCGVVFGLKP